MDISWRNMVKIWTIARHILVLCTESREKTAICRGRKDVKGMRGLLKEVDQVLLYEMCIITPRWDA